jgi:hypothetical protein
MTRSEKVLLGKTRGNTLASARKFVFMENNALFVFRVSCVLPVHTALWVHGHLARAGTWHSF